MGRVLIVGHDPHQQKLLATALAQDGHTIFHAAGAEAARVAFRERQYEAVLLDRKLLDGAALNVMAATREVDPDVSVILMAENDQLEASADRAADNVFELPAKPLLPDVAKVVVRRACDMTRLLRENTLLRAELQRWQAPPEIFGNAPVMQELRDEIARVAPTSASVLITGESGAGKELAARAIHRQSRRAEKPFVVVNCAAPAEILERELFGHESGTQSRAGLLEAAHEGTVFLDEIAETSEGTQAKLLRLLTDGQARRIGSNRAYSADVRVVAATRQNLEERVGFGLFRRDLYERLAVKIVMPPLRERTADIGGLSDLFLRKITQELKLPPRRLSSAGLLQLQSYEFPGNVRELRNLLERAAVLSTAHEIGVEYFPLRLEQRRTAESFDNGRSGLADLTWVEALPPSFDLRNLLSSLEKALIERTLQSTRGAQAEAARRLGLSRSDLSYKLLKYELRKETAAS
jgi:DNA-binding NtrC family response regulator